MRLVDVHAHLDMLEDIESIISNADSAGVKLVISNGTDPDSNRKVLELSERFEMVKPALGIYPNDSIMMSADEFGNEIKFIEDSNPIAIGEIGLDYKDDVDRELMKERFEMQVKLAKKLEIPVIVHSRKAEEDVIEILEQSGHKKIVMHCFSGKKRLVQRIIDNGWGLSIPCNVVRSKHFQNIVDMAPLRQLFTETDSPFLGPYPGKKNEPANISVSITKIAEIKGMDEEEIANQIFMNYQKIFL